MKQLFANNAAGMLNAGILNTDLSLVLQAGQGALFPSPTNGDYFKVTLIDASGNIEIIKCTQRTGDTYNTITRGEEGTTPRTFATPTKVQLRLTKVSSENCEPRPTLDTIVGNTTLDSGDFSDLKIVTATATVSLPATTAVTVGEWVELKSITTGSVLLAPNGTDTIDGVNANYRLPSFCTCRAMKTAAGQWTLVKRPEQHVGQIIDSGVATTPLGALPLDAAAVSRTTYKGLFDEIGTTFGVGDGATTFNVPDPQGRSLVGTGAGASLTARALGDKFGAETHTLTQAETPLKAHFHTGSIPTTQNLIGGVSGAFVNLNTQPLGDTPTASDSSATAHSIQNPGLAVKMYIKT